MKMHYILYFIHQILSLKITHYILKRKARLLRLSNLNIILIPIIYKNKQINLIRSQSIVIFKMEQQQFFCTIYTRSRNVDYLNILYLYANLSHWTLRCKVLNLFWHFVHMFYFNFLRLVEWELNLLPIFPVFLLNCGYMLKFLQHNWTLFIAKLTIAFTSWIWSHILGVFWICIPSYRA